MRIDFSTSDDLTRVAESGAAVYARLVDSQGNAYLLALADAATLAALADAALPARVLDPGSARGGYYLLGARTPDDLHRAAALVEILYQDAHTAVARATPFQAEELSALGIEIQRLDLHPLTLPPHSYSPNAPIAITPIPMVQGILDQVDSAALYDYLGGLSGEWAVDIGGTPYTIATRYSRTTTPIEKATQYGFEHMNGLGLAVQYHYYNLPSSGQRRNVVAEQPGVGQPDRIFLITAHLDSTSNDPYNSAPGADDNGSGSIGVFTAANILSRYNFDCTLRYVLFTGEEQGLYGSDAYAADAAAAGDNIEGVVNMDMIGYDSDAFPIIDLHARSWLPDSVTMANLFVDVVNAYSLSLTPDVLIDDWLGDYSDNKSFWDEGYAAILAIEDDDDFTPYYHTTGDLLSTINLAYYTDFVKASLGTLAHMGCLLNEPGHLAGVVTDEATGLPIPEAFVEAAYTGGVYTTTTAADGSYQIDLFPDEYTIGVQAEGYNPAVFADFWVTNAQTTTLNVPLTISTCAPVSGPDFTFVPLAPVAGEPVTFTGTVALTSTPPVSYAWDFGDGNAGAGQVASHTYPAGGAFTAVMTATNCGGAVFITQPVTVIDQPDMQADPAEFNVFTLPNASLTKTLTLTNAGTAALTWTLAADMPAPWLTLSEAAGVVAPGDVQPVVLTFTAPITSGMYTVALQLESGDPDTPLISIPVTMTVVCIPIYGITFDYTPAIPQSGEPVTFTATILGEIPPITYTWEFGDGDWVSGPGLGTVTHTYPVTNTWQTYTVMAIAANGCAAPAFTTGDIAIPPRLFETYLPLITRAP